MSSVPLSQEAKGVTRPAGHGGRSRAAAICHWASHPFTLPRRAPAVLCWQQIPLVPEPAGPHHGSVIHIHAVRVDDVSLSVRTWPCEEPLHPPVVLLAGTGATAADWDRVSDDLSRDRVVHAIDLRGHGSSTWPGRYSIRAMSADIASALPVLAERPDVIGHSLGGLVACVVASGDALVRRLVLEDVGVPHPRTPSPPERPSEDLEFDWAVVEQVRSEIDRPDPSWRHLLGQITAPTLVVGGGPASFVPDDHVRELAAVVADGTVTTIDAGHLVHATRPGEFLRAVRAHLDPG